MKAQEISKSKKIYETFREHNKMGIFAKYMLSLSIYRNAHVKLVTIVLEDGTEIKFDSRESKTFKKFMKSLNPPQATKGE